MKLANFFDFFCVCFFSVFLLFVGLVHAQNIKGIEMQMNILEKSWFTRKMKPCKG